MHLLLTNDDGIYARGIEALEQVVSEWGQAVILAPIRGLSGCSHQATTDDPLRIESLDDRRVAVHGTPADCVRLGLVHLAPQTEWVLSGINDGANLGVDIHMSGTVAAAREAALLGRQAIAISQYRRPARTIDWQFTAEMTRHVLAQLLGEPLAAGMFWNVNLPDLDDTSRIPEIVFRPPDPAPLPLHYEPHDTDQFLYRTNYHARPRTPGCDVDACFTGCIVISQLSASPAR